MLELLKSQKVYFKKIKDWKNDVSQFETILKN